MEDIKKWLKAVATISGAVIGLGIFAIPYASRETGILPTTTLIMAIACVIILLNLLFAEIIIFNGREECIVAYARRYLGGWAGRVEALSIILGYGGAILAYTLAAAVFLQALFALKDEYFWPIVLLYSAATGVVIIWGIRGLGRLEFILTGGMLIIFSLVYYESLPEWKAVPYNWENLILPYGVIWFALVGESSIPIAVKILRDKEKSIGSVILIAYLIIVLFTVLFFVSAISVGGPKVGPDPFIAMGEKMGRWVTILGSIAGILAVVTSSWVLATYFKKILVSDVKINPILSWLLVTLGPLVLIIFGVSNFVSVISLIGIVAGTVDALIILAIYNKIFRKKNTVPRAIPFKIPKPVIQALFFILLGAAISALISL